MDNVFDVLLSKVAESAGIKTGGQADERAKKPENNEKPHKPHAKITYNEIRSMTGKEVSEITAEKAADETLTAEDIRINGDTLRMQADAARNSGQQQLAEALERAAEMTVIPEKRLLEMYNMLRAGRSGEKQLEDLVWELEKTYNAPLTARLVRSAAAAYKKRDMLKK